MLKVKPEMWQQIRLCGSGRLTNQKLLAKWLQKRNLSFFGTNRGGL